MAEPTRPQPLANRRIGLPESRQLDLFAEMLEQRGARIERCPLVAIHDTPNTSAITRWLDEVTGNGLQTMIWLTGEGVQRLAAFATARNRRHDLLAALAKANAITRGPKPVRALRALGLGDATPAATPTTGGVIETLDNFALAGTRVGVQLYGQEPNCRLIAALEQRGATPVPVAPYVYADAADEATTQAFIERIMAGALDAVAFTSASQVKRLFQIAGRRELSCALARSLNERCVAAVGPLVADALQTYGVAVTLMPTDNYFMKPLVRKLVAYFHES